MWSCTASMPWCLSLSETNLQRLISGKSNLASKFLMNLARSLAMKLLRNGHPHQ